MYVINLEWKTVYSFETTINEAVSYHKSYYNTYRRNTMYGDILK